MHCCRVAPRACLEAALAQSALSLVSRSGPTVPVEAAAASVWHPLHPASPVNTVLPAAALVLAEAELVEDVPEDDVEVVEDEPDAELDDEDDDEPPEDWDP